MAHHHESPRRLRKMIGEVPQRLEETVRRLLAKQPNKRFLSYEKAIQSLLMCASDDSVRRVKQAKPEFRIPSRKLGSFDARSDTRRTLFSGFRRRVAWCFGSILLVALSSWTIFYPANGTLKIFLDDLQVTITVNGHGVKPKESDIDSKGDRFEITLKLPPGDSEIVVQKKGASDRERRQVKISANSVSEITITLNDLQTQSESNESAILNADDGLPRTAHLLVSSGRWEIEDERLCHFDGRGEQWLVFGDTSWTDYDYSFDARHLGFPSGFSALFRSPVDERITLFSFGWIDLRTAQVRMRVGDNFFEPVLGPDGPYYKQLDWLSQKDQWYRVMVKVRGEKASCFVDGAQIFEVIDLPYDTGRVGIRMWRTWRGKSEFKNFNVRSPDGDVLWSGLPDLPNP